MLFWVLCIASYSGTVVLSCQVINTAQRGHGEALLMAGARLGSALLLAGEKMTASPLTLETLGLSLRFSGQIDLCTWHCFNFVRGCSAFLC